MNHEARLAGETVIGTDRHLARPLHDEMVVAFTVLPGGDAVAVFRADLTGPGHSPRVRTVELSANLSPAGTVLSYKVARETIVPMPNPCGPGGKDRTTKSVMHHVTPARAGRYLSVEERRDCDLCVTYNARPRGPVSKWTIRFEGQFTLCRPCADDMRSGADHPMAVA